jgi:two-component system OmpR family sensor kinase
VVVALALTCGATYIFLRAFLLQQVNDRLTAQQPPFCEGLIHLDDPDGDETRPARFAAEGTCINPDQIQYEPYSGIKAVQLDGPSVATAWTTIRTPFTATTVDGQRVRAVSSPTRTGGRLVVIDALTGVDETLTRLILLELLIGGLVLAGTIAMAVTAVEVGLRPLDRVTRTARSVADDLSSEGSALDRRVPVQAPETEVGQLADAFNRMLDAVQIEYAERRRREDQMRQFLADASHELRTPLTSVRGYAELVRLSGGAQNEVADDSLRRIEGEGARMSRLVEDLLTLARSDRDEIARPHRPVDLSASVRDAVDGLRAAFPNRIIEETAEGGSWVLGDPDQLRRIAVNLLGNALTHTDGAVRTQIHGADGGILLTISDDGPGLPPVQATRVFERFWRADAARTRARGGSGLGLSIVDALVSTNGGRISFESSVPDGTTVRVWFPQLAEEPSQPLADELPSEDRTDNDS